MGTARWDLAAYGRVRGSGAASVIGEYKTGGIHTTTTSASNLTDGAAGAGSAVTASVGDVLHITCDELARVRIGGTAATATAGFLLQPDVARDIEITASGTISIIDEA
jgi:hypothetical protein